MEFGEPKRFNSCKFSFAARRVLMTHTVYLSVIGIKMGRDDMILNNWARRAAMNRKQKGIKNGALRDATCYEPLKK